jgi:hypothetical protein
MDFVHRPLFKKSPGRKNISGIWTFCPHVKKWRRPLRYAVYFLVTQQPNSALGHLIVDVSRSHTKCRTPLNEWSAHHRGRYLQNTQQTQEKNIIPWTGFEPAIPAIEQPQTYALESTATGIGQICRLDELFSVTGAEQVLQWARWYEPKVNSHYNMLSRLLTSNTINGTGE